MQKKKIIGVTSRYVIMSKKKKLFQHKLHGSVESESEIYSETEERWEIKKKS